MMKDNGRRYTGEFVQGRRQGKGEMTFTNGDKVAVQLNPRLLIFENSYTFTYEYVA